MSSEEPATPGGGRPHLKLTDPRAMRALAHPTRLALLEALGLREPLTATEAADIVGESPTNCAFHLRTLAKYGFVEEAEGGSGRRRPWRRSHSGFSLDSDEASRDPESRLAADVLAGVALESWLGRIREVLTHRSVLPPAQERLLGMNHTMMFLTPGEAEELSREVKALLSRHDERSEHPRLRPADSVPVEIMHFTLPGDALRADGR